MPSRLTVVGITDALLIALREWRVKGVTAEAALTPGSPHAILQAHHHERPVVAMTILGAHVVLGRFGTRWGLWTHQGILETVGLIWQERAAIAEFDGGLSREQAEELAWSEVNAFLAAIELDPNRLPAGAGVTSQWLPPPPSYYGDVTLP